MTDPTVVTATRLEAWAARWTLPRGTTVRRVGVGLTVALPEFSGSIISCGLAGALSADLLPGTIVIPEIVGLATGEFVSCDPTLVATLIAAARKLGTEPVTGPLLTAPGLITGPDRRDWAGRGFVAVDMESGPLLQRHRGAVVRVILDTPAHELAPEWESPRQMLTAPRLWPEAVRLAIAAPRYARLAARVVQVAIAP